MLKLAGRTIVRVVVVFALMTMTFDYLAPPATHWGAANWQETTDIVSAQVGTISLKGCHYVVGDTVGQVHEGGVWRRTNITVDKKVSALPELRWADMGRWEWQKVHPDDAVDRVIATASFICGDAPVTVSVGPFDVGG